MHNFLVLGGDLRQLYLSRILVKNGFQTTVHYGKTSSFSAENAVKSSNILLCPIPFTKDKINLFSVNGLEDLNIGNLLSFLTPEHLLFGGSIPDYVKVFARENGIPCFDYMEIETVTVKNTIATAEGAVAEAIRLSPGLIHREKCLVAGFGRCGKTLALKLKGLEGNVTVADRKEESLALAGSMGFRTKLIKDLSEDLSDYSYIFNTVPAPVFGEELISLMNPSVTVIDIASAPGGVDMDFCKKQNVRAKLCLGLPGIYAPKASAEILYHGIIRCLEERSFL